MPADNVFLKNSTLVFKEMMACSYLSATGPKAQPSMAGCWTPPYSLPEPEPTRMAPYIPATASTITEPALDLTTTIKPRPCSDEDTE